MWRKSTSVYSNRCEDMKADPAFSSCTCTESGMGQNCSCDCNCTETQDRTPIRHYQCTCLGVDLNRNWDVQWKQPETKGISDFILQRRGEIQAYLTLHSYSQRWLYPYGYNSTKIPPDHEDHVKLAEIAIAAIKRVHGKQYQHGRLSDFYYANLSGTSLDWAYEKAGIVHSYAIELWSQSYWEYNMFDLPTNQIVPTAQEMFPAFIQVGLYVWDGPNYEYVPYPTSGVGIPWVETGNENGDCQGGGVVLKKTRSCVPLLFLPFDPQLPTRLMHAELAIESGASYTRVPGEGLQIHHTGLFLWLTRLVEEWTDAMDKGEIVGCVFLDLRKAFDKVWHAGLLSKLKSYGISRLMHDWFSSYLSGRKQRVVIQGATSTWKSPLAGVPQGSVPGPTLFILYINDLATSRTHCLANLFADDTSLSFSHHSVHRVVATLNRELSTVSTWLSTWKLEANIDKCKVMFITTRTLPQPIPPVTLGKTVLQVVTSYKHLGVTLTNTPSWSQHIEVISNKARRSSGLLCALRRKIPQNLLLRLYITITRPTLEYADIVWAGLTLRDQRTLESVQYQTARLISGHFGIPYPSYNSLYTELSLPSLQFRRKFHTAVTMYKLLNGRCPPHLQSLLPRARASATESRYPLRNTWAIDIAMGTDVTQVRYNESKMRAHLLDCLNSGTFLSPRVRQVTSLRASADHRVKIAPPITVGDLVYLHADRTKSQARNRYIVTAVHRDFAYISKFIGRQLRSRSYKVRLAECYLVPNQVPPHDRHLACSEDESEYASSDERQNFPLHDDQADPPSHRLT
ncbi:corticosteroid- binding protein [Branchiostoma belcheri]|nr:corticosteroid- binding protein [Branchiostoma belcheri]